MANSLQQLEALYSNAQTCARLVGLRYIEGEAPGYQRQKRGKGFRYLNSRNQVLADKELTKRITELVSFLEQLFEEEFDLLKGKTGRGARI